jgi:hypothetical protein
MFRRTTLRLAVVSIAILPLLPLGAADPALDGSFFPFVIPWDDVAAGTAVDVSALSAMPAGAGGMIQVKDGVFVEEKAGRRIRFFATNLTARAAFPTRADADKIALRMARLGINLVRMHHLQNDWEKDGGTIWKPGKPFLEVDPKQVDALDYLIGALKKQGIYTNLNLTTTREYLPEHGFPETVKQIPFKHHKKVDRFNRRMIELQKEYARALLDHVNPYTELAYRDEPALAFVEINNENALVGWPNESVGEGLDTLPEPFRSEIQTLWNTWLQARYRTDSALVRAWSAEATPLGPSLLPAKGFAFENQAIRTAAAAVTVPGEGGATGSMRLTVKDPLEGEWLVQGVLGPVTLQEGKAYTLSFRARADRERSIGVKIHLDRPDWREHGLKAQAKLGKSWQEYSFGFVATGTEPKHSRIAFLIGGQPVTVEIDRAELRPGLGPWALPQGQGLAERSVALATDASFGRRLVDWKDFLLETDKAFALEMRSYLRNGLGIRVPIIDSQVQWGGLTSLDREESMEFADTHVYWAHPEFHGKGWDPVNWNVKREAHVDVLDKGQGILAEVALHRVTGRPFAVSEYNHPAPNDFRVEMMPLVMSVAGLQDWDAVYTFAYPPTGTGEENDVVAGFFDTGLDVAKMAFHPSTAFAFRKGLVAPLSSEERFDLASRPWERAKNAPQLWGMTGGAPDILRTRASIGIVGASKDERKKSGIPGTPTFLRRNGRGAVWGIDTPAFKATAGFIGGETIEFADSSLGFSTFGPSGEGFAAATLVDLEGQPLQSSRRALLTLVGRVYNVGMGWDAKRTTVGDKWGKGPMQVEGIPCTVSMRLDKRLDVWSLDGSGRRVQKVPTRWSESYLSFEAGPQWKTVWYEIADPSLRVAKDGSLLLPKRK